jgi:hypothetical protein
VVFALFRRYNIKILVSFIQIVTSLTFLAGSHSFFLRNLLRHRA